MRIGFGREADSVLREFRLAARDVTVHRWDAYPAKEYNVGSLFRQKRDEYLTEVCIQRRYFSLDVD